jgi:hypothetical protein
MRRAILLATLGANLAGCATTNFAPPFVNTNVPVRAQASSCVMVESAPYAPSGVATSAITLPPVRGGDKSLTQSMQVDLKYGEPAIPPNFRGARILIENYRLAYQCAAHEAADGRQIFQVPSFLTAAAAATGVAFGLNEDQILGLGLASSVFRAGNSYYAPKEKAAMLDRALDAVVCIKSESTTAKFFNTDEDAPNAFTAAAAGGGTITITPDEKYFEMVGAALASVDRILGNRLRDAGSDDFQSVIDEMKTLVPKSEPSVDDAKTLKQSLRDGSNLVEAVTIDLDALQARMQICVLRAKL